MSQTVDRDGRAARRPAPRRPQSQRHHAARAVREEPPAQAWAPSSGSVRSRPWIGSEMGSMTSRPPHRRFQTPNLSATFPLGSAWPAGAALGLQNRCGAVRLSRAGSIPVRFRQMSRACAAVCEIRVRNSGSGDVITRVSFLGSTIASGSGANGAPKSRLDHRRPEVGVAGALHDAERLAVPGGCRPNGRSRCASSPSASKY